MKELDPLEQTQENLHPVIVAHRARHDEPPAPGGGSPVSVSAALLSAVLIGGAVLVWLYIAAGS